MLELYSFVARDDFLRESLCYKYNGVFDGLLVAAGLLASLVTNAQGNIHIQCASAIEKAPGSSGKRGHHLALAVCGCD